MKYNDSSTMGPRGVLLRTETSTFTWTLYGYTNKSCSVRKEVRKSSKNLLTILTSRFERTEARVATVVTRPFFYNQQSTVDLSVLIDSAYVDKIFLGE